MKNSRNGYDIKNTKYCKENHSMPNSKPKRIRHNNITNKEIEDLEEMLDWYDFRVNILGIFGAIAIGIFCPLSLSWKASIIILLLMSSCQAEKRED